MSGGIALSLVIIAFVVLGAVGAFMYLTGGIVSLSDRSDETDEEQRPLHKAPSSPTEENRHIAGVEPEVADDEG